MDSAALLAEGDVDEQVPGAHAALVERDPAGYRPRHAAPEACEWPPARGHLPVEHEQVSR